MADHSSWGRFFRRFRREKEEEKEPENEIEHFLTPKEIDDYQDLFSLFQTQPKYLSRLLPALPLEQEEYFVDHILFPSIYSNEKDFNPQQEMLIYDLFRKIVEKEAQKNEPLLRNRLVVKIFVMYKRPKTEYLVNILKPAMKIIYAAEDFQCDFSPNFLLKSYINEQEIKTGNKSVFDRSMSDEEALEIPEVKKRLDYNIEKTWDVCQLIIEAILDSAHIVPYGVRYMCKTIAQAQPVPEEEIHRLMSFYFFYRYINLAIITPDVGDYFYSDRDLTPNMRKWCVLISKLLQRVFNLRIFDPQEGAESVILQCLNPFLEDYIPKIRNFYTSELINVDDPKFENMELEPKPTQITVQNIIKTHELVKRYLNVITNNEDDDPFRQVAMDLRGVDLKKLSQMEEEKEVTLTSRGYLTKKAQ